MKKQDLPKTIPVFPLSNFIIFPHTTVPLNIFEPRYIEMINDSMKTNKMIGLIQPKNNDDSSIPGLHKVGCLGKIINFKDTSDGRYMIDLNGITRFEVTNEIKSTKPYRICETTYDNFELDLTSEKKKLKLSDLESIFKDLKLVFEKKGYSINCKSLEKQDLNETINVLAMASPFSLEEKQILLESTDRIKSMSLVHQRLYEKGTYTEVEFQTYSSQIIENLISSYKSGANTCFEINTNENIDIDFAITLGLILNEIITNTLKHNPGQKNLKIELTFVKKNNTYELKVSDNGKGLDITTVQKKNTLGMRLISILTKQLEGELQITSKKDEGVTYTITISMS
mgnify:CR=1 FL=1